MKAELLAQLIGRAPLTPSLPYFLPFTPIILLCIPLNRQTEKETEKVREGERERQTREGPGMNQVNAVLLPLTRNRLE